MDKFEYPEKIRWDEQTYTNFYGRLNVEPLERGYAMTVGNTLRRVLLSSVGGVAITAVRIEGAPHEFTSLEGVKEDVTDIILNLKQVCLKSNVSTLPDEPFRIEITGKNEILAGELFPGPELTVLNPSLHIASLSQGTVLVLYLKVNTGFGYVPVSRMDTEGNPIGTIPMAASFSPVVRVALRTENTRVGQRVDYERLIIEVWTNGAVTPREAVKATTDILKSHFELIAAVPSEKQAEGFETTLPELGGTALEGSGLSTRVVNILKGNGVGTVEELCRHDRGEVAGFKNLGDKALAEIEEFLKNRQLNLRGQG